LYDDGSAQIVSGCKCGGKLFFFVKKERLEEIRNATAKLSTNEKQQIESDVFEIIGGSTEFDEPVVLDFESIRILKPGKYEIDLINLFKNKPLVYKLDEGKYMIDLPESFQNMAKGKKKK
jgi:predicted  nucleic acid-binding Zn-ribbon protein